MTWIKACAVEELRDGEGRCVRVTGNAPIAIWKLKDEFFATADTCTHNDASLSESGDIEDEMIVCGLHEAKYDLRTGAALELPAEDDLQTFFTKVEDGEIYVEVQE